MPPIALSKRDARKLFLASQGLLRSNTFGRGVNAAARAIDRIGYVQIDTISVVNRAHEHVLKSRVSNFEGEHLNRLMRRRQIYEYWGHAAAFLPMEHFRYSLPVMNGWASTREADRRLTGSILDRIRIEGPLQSRHFEDTRGRGSSGWWDWKPAKQALEHLFLSGELMVSHREGFQKVYDLRESIVPSHINTSEPGLEEWAEFIVLNQLSALGAATEQDIGYTRSTVRRLAKLQLKQPISDALQHLTEEGRIIAIDVEGQAWYTTACQLDSLPLRVSRKEVRVLSPFDNLVINRNRLAHLFDFDYQLECYVPAAKRKYGYFVLPLLLGDEMIGRMDARADRKTHQLTVHNLVLEPAVKPEQHLLEALSEGIRRFALANDCEHFIIEQSSPTLLRRQLPIH
jgi:uncharacterized protein YcaQ